MRVLQCLSRSLRVLVVAGALVGGDGPQALDWPMSRCDVLRGGSTPEALPSDLVLHWSAALAPPRPAWPEEPRLYFDVAPEPIAAGGLVLLASSAEDCVRAFDAATGEERWRFTTGGPVRHAPVVSDGRVFVASDDGFLYVLDAASGGLLWQRRGGPDARRVLGNGRLISAWPARGGPVVAGGVVYFAAGIWPFQGVFVHALRVVDGGAVWTQDGAGSLYLHQPHHSAAFAGLAPQGCLALTNNSLVVPNGRAAPACLERSDGSLRHLNLVQNRRTETCVVACSEQFYVNAGAAYDLTTGALLGSFSPGATVLDGDRLFTAAYAAAKAGAAAAAEDETARTLVVKAYEAVVAPALGAADLSVAWLDSHRRLSYQFEAAGEKARRLLRTDRQSGERLELKSSGYGRTLEHRDGEGRTCPAVELAFTDQVLAAAALKGTLASRCEVKVFFVYDADSGRAIAEVERRFPAAAAAAGTIRRGATEETSVERVRVPLEVQGLSPGHDGASEPKDSPLRRRGSPLVSSLRLRSSWSVEDRGTSESASPKVAGRVLAGSESSLREPRVGPVLARAGETLYAGRPGRVLVIEPPEGSSRKARVRRSLEIDGVPGSISAAGGRLFVATTGGRLLAFGGREARPGAQRRVPAPARALRAVSAGAGGDEARLTARRLVKERGLDGGHALVIGDGRWVDALLAESALELHVFLPDPNCVVAERARLQAAGMYGARASVDLLGGGDGLSIEDLPQYFVSLAVLEDGAAGSTASLADLARRVFRVLRPYGGAVVLPAAGAKADEIALRIGSLKLDNAHFEPWSGQSLLVRRGPLPGAGSWTHQYGDAARSGFSADNRVKLPLELLWFGGASNAGTLPRHGHGPCEQVIGGRLFLEGADVIRATDVYTGRLLWESPLPGVGAAFDNTSHQPGANSLGTNFVATADSIYVAYADACLRLDAATGSRLAELRLAEDPRTRRPRRWGSLAVWNGVLVAGASPVAFSSPEYEEADFGGFNGKKLAMLEQKLSVLEEFPGLVRRDEEGARAFMVRALNRLIASRDLAARITPLKVPAEVAAQRGELAASASAALAELSPDAVPTGEIVTLHRRLLETHFADLPRLKPARPGAKDVWDATASERLLGVDRLTGKTLWEMPAELAFRNNAVALGGGRVYAIDRLPAPVEKKRRRRGESVAKARVLAFDVASGAPVWRAAAEAFGTWLSYSEEHDVLVQASRPSRDMLSDEPGDRLMCLSAADGMVLWDRKVHYQGPCLLHHDTLITQGKAFSLLDGRDKRVRNPLTGAEMPWTFVRNYGCNHAVASEHLLTFRSGAAGFFDLERHGGTGNFGGFRSGCTSNLIAADGVLNAPEYTRTCTCSFQNQTSIALVSSADAEMWTFTDLEIKDDRIRRLGLNLAAPGDRVAGDGTLWIECPEVGGPSPEVTVDLEPADAVRFVRHSSVVRPGGDTQSEAAPAWVFASGLEGLRRLSVDVVRRPGGRRSQGAGRTALPERVKADAAAGDTSGAQGGDFDSDEVDEDRGTPSGADVKPEREATKAAQREPPGPAVAELAYTVRLYFLEPRDLAPGARVFDVHVQGVRALSGLDIVKEAGGPRRGIVRELRGVRIRRTLEVRLEPTPGAGGRGAVLCGVELRVESPK